MARVKHQAFECISLFLPPSSSDDFRHARLVDHVELRACAELANVMSRRRRPAFALLRQIVQRVAKSCAACKRNMRGMEGGLSCANTDVQELQMGRQWARYRERGFEDNFVGVATAHRDKDGFHLEASAARREIGNS